MNAIVIEHVPVADLPAAWRDQLAAASGATVTIRIEQEGQNAERLESYATDDPAFGMWRDRSDMADVAAHVRQLRKPRYTRDGSPAEP
jgi:hypothetical protein